MSTRPSLADYLPLSPNGSIVVTSRSQEVVKRPQVYKEDILDVRPMDREIAQDLLRKKMKKGGRGSTDDDMGRLVTELDGMPQVISQAAAYIDQCARHVTVSDYIKTLQRNDQERTHQVRDSAARLLALMSLFDRDGIPAHLLRGQYLEAADHKLDFEDDVAALRAYSLVSIGADEDLFKMHRLVQLSTQQWLAMPAELAGWQERFVEVMGKTFPTGTFVHWAICQALFGHVEVMGEYAISSRGHLWIWAQVLYNGSRYAWQRGQYEQAADMVRSSLDVRQGQLGADDATTLDSMGILASVLQNQGNYSEAEEMKRRALAGSEKVLGMDHPSM